MPSLSASTSRGLERDVRQYIPGLVLDARGDRVRVGHAWPAVDGLSELAFGAAADYQLTDWNRLYYETTFDQRPDDRSDDTEFVLSLPRPRDLFQQFVCARERGVAAVDSVQAGVTGPQFERFHERIERCKLRANRLEHDRDDALQPEWNPEDGHNDRRDADTLGEMNSSRKDAHLVDFRDVVGLSYYSLWNARHALVAGRYDRDDARGVLARATLDVSDEHQCADCGALLPPVRLLSWPARDYWLCDSCADEKRRPESVQAAREKRYEKFADRLDHEDYREFGDEYEYHVRVTQSRIPERDRYGGDDRDWRFFVTVAQGGEQVSWFARERDSLVERLSEHLQRRAERRLLDGRLVGPVPLEPSTVHVDDRTPADLAATDVIPQASLGDYAASADV